MRGATLLALAALTLPASAAAAPRKPARAAPLPPVVHVRLTTSLGDITVAADVAKAPLTATNFVRAVDARAFDGTSFYRAMVLDWGTPPNGLIQAGTRGDPRRWARTVAHEPTSATGLKHVAGALSMARLAPGTARADFSILLSDMPGLDADPAAPGDNAGYAVFGQVIAGMDVARRIFDAPRSATAGEGLLKGQMLASPVTIIRARRVAAPTVPVVTVPPAAAAAVAAGATPADR